MQKFRAHIQVIWMIFLLAVALVLSVSTASAQSSKSGGSGLLLKWTSADGESGESKVSTTLNVEEKKALIFVRWVPAFDVASANDISEDEPKPLPVKASKSGKAAILLPRAQGKLSATLKDGATVEVTYELQKATSRMALASSCKKRKFKSKFSAKVSSAYPALLACPTEKDKDQDPDQIVFSTLEGAEWYGTKAFETGGKGERWKTFAASEITTLGDWEISWGEEEAINKIQILAPNPAREAPKTPKPSFVAEIAMSYLTGTVTRNTLSADIGGIQLPLSVLYHKDKAWWSLGGSYELFLYSMSKVDGKSNSVNSFEIFGGAERAFGAFTARGTLGYFSRNLEAPGVRITSSFETFRIGGDVFYERPEGTYGVRASYAQSFSDGDYTELAAQAYFQKRLLLKKEMRFFVGMNQLSASTKTIDLKSDWIGAGVAMQFGAF